MFVLHVAPHIAPAQRGVVMMTTGYNATALPAVRLQERTAGGNSVVTWRRGQPEPDVSSEAAMWWLPTLLRRRGLWATEALSRDDAGAFALGLAFCGAIGSSNPKPKPKPKPKP